MREILQKLKGIAFDDIKKRQKEALNDPKLTPTQIAAEIMELEELRERIMSLLTDR